MIDLSTYLPLLFQEPESPKYNNHLRLQDIAPEICWCKLKVVFLR
jgi:hypothetical protein